DYREGDRLVAVGHSGPVGRGQNRDDRSDRLLYHQLKSINSRTVRCGLCSCRVGGLHCHVVVPIRLIIRCSPRSCNGCFPSLSSIVICKSVPCSIYLRPYCLYRHIYTSPLYISLLWKQVGSTVTA